MGGVDLAGKPLIQRHLMGEPFYNGFPWPKPPRPQSRAAGSLAHPFLRKCEAMPASLLLSRRSRTPATPSSMVEKTGQGDEDGRSNFVGARRAVPKWVLKIQKYPDRRSGPHGFTKCRSYKFKAGRKGLFFLPDRRVAGVTRRRGFARLRPGGTIFKWIPHPSRSNFFTQL